jgi:hypothetical protein
MRKPIVFRSAIAVAFIWCVVMPFVFAGNVSHRFGFAYSESLRIYTPELIVGALALVALSAAWLLRSWAAGALLVVACITPVLRFGINIQTSDAWVLTALLLLFVVFNLRREIKQPNHA